MLTAAESPVAALRETLRSSPPAARTAANGRPDPSPTERSPEQNSDAQARAEESRSIDRESQPGTRTGVRAAAAGGSHAGHLAAEDGAAATPSEPAEIATTGVEITREGTLRSGAGQAESSSYAAAAPVPLEGPFLMPAATLTTGTADYELSPAERNYFERYQRYREATP